MLLPPEHLQLLSKGAVGWLAEAIRNTGWAFLKNINVMVFSSVNWPLWFTIGVYSKHSCLCTCTVV